MNSGFPDRQKGFFRKLVSIIFFPLIFTNLGVELTLWLFTNILLGPCMALLWRTRRYLADASSVELTRNADAMASALQRLSEDTNAVSGGEWASHLFLVDPKGDRSLRGAVPSEEQKARVLKAWAATAAVNVPSETASPAVPVGDPAINEYAQFRSEMMATALRAAGGDANAIARMQAMAQAMGSDADIDLHNMPNPADIMAARHGDKAALARIQKLRQTRTATPRQSQSGLQMASMISFHPPLKRRAKRLQRMGSHILTPAGSGWGLRIAMTIMWLIIGPLLAVAGVAMLLVMGIVIMFNLVLLTVWLTVIHWAFGQDWVANFNGFVNFVNELIRAFSKR